MTDYGHEVSFGVSLDPRAGSVAEAITLARRAEHLGLDLLALQDHAYRPAHVDTWTLLTYLSAATERISVMTDVVDLQLRPPAMLAKAASSLAVLNGGRVQLGVGAGPFPHAIAGMGAPLRGGPAMVEYADAAVEILLQALRGGPIEAGNDEHHVSYVAGPVATKIPGVWVGAQRRRMLQLVGRRAEGWVSPLNIYVPPEDVPDKHRIIDRAARSAGRDPADIRRIYNVMGTIVTNAGDPGQRAQDGRHVVGTPLDWADFLTRAVVELGFDTFIFWPSGDATSELEAFAGEVVPAVRHRVTAVRGA